MIFVHLPDVVVLDGKNDESVGVFLKEWLWEWSLSLGIARILRLEVVGNSIESNMRNLGVNVLRILEILVLDPLVLTVLLLRVVLLDHVVVVGVL